MTLSEEGVTNSSGTTVQAVTSKFGAISGSVEGYDLNGRIATSSSVSAAKGLTFISKSNYLSILNLKVGDRVIVTYSYTDEKYQYLTFNAENLPYTKDGVAVNKGDNVISEAEYTMTADGTFDMYCGNSKGYRIQSLTIIPAKTIQAGSNGYTAYSNSLHNFTVSGAEVYYAPNGVSDGTITLSKVVEGAVIPMNEGVIIKAENAGDDIVISMTTAEATDLSGNNLKAVNLSSTLAEGTNYVLGTKEGTTKFFSFTSANWTNTLRSSLQGKCYLNIPASSSKENIEISFGEATGIESLTPTLSRREGVYNLSGVRVNGDYKGIVIMNGKKYMNK